MTGRDKCIITMGHVWFLSVLIKFCHKINEKLKSDKLRLAKLIWWFKGEQLELTKHISKVIKSNPNNKTSLHGLRDGLLEQFETKFATTFGRFQQLTIFFSTCPNLFKLNIEWGNDSAVIVINKDGSQNTQNSETESNSTNNNLAQEQKDFVKRPRNLQQAWRLLHNKTWGNVFNHEEEGKTNLEILPLISHHNQKSWDGTKPWLRHLCTKFFLIWKCNSGKDCL